MATIKNLVIDQGATFTTTIVLSDALGNLLDLTDYATYASLRKSYASITAVDLNATRNPTFTTGEITLSMTAAETAALRPGRYVYDVDIVSTDDDSVTRVVEGIVTVNPGVTKGYLGSGYLGSV